MPPPSDRPAKEMMQAMQRAAQPLPAAASVPGRARRRPAAIAAASGRQQGVAVAPPDVPEASALRLSAPAAAGMAAAAALAAAWGWQQWQRNRASEAAARNYDGGMGLLRPAQNAATAELDPEYKMALARTRQATAIHRAIGFLITGERARAHVEVRRALHQNSLCRSPLLSTQHSKGELLELYRLFLQQSEVPADFGTLLQLRALLELDFEEAEQIEREVGEQSAFSI